MSKEKKAVEIVGECAKAVTGAAVDGLFGFVKDNMNKRNMSYDRLEAADTVNKACNEMFPDMAADAARQLVGKHIFGIEERNIANEEKQITGDE